MSDRTSKLRPWIWAAAVSLLAVIVGFWTEPRWSAWLESAAPAANGGEANHDHGHDHGHDHAGHEDANSIELSAQARRNIGLKTGAITLGDFQRTITVPAMVVGRPGRTEIRITAPLTGVITDVFATAGEAVEPGDTLFILRLTHEDLVQAQTEFLKTLEALDVENREIARLENLTQGVVAGKVVLERKYEKQKLQGLLKAQRQALLLHGLSPSQVDEIAARRHLLQELQVVVPEVHDETDENHLHHHHASLTGFFPHAENQQNADPPHPVGDTDVLVLQNLAVHKGDFVQVGAVLASLQDLETLYIEGRAFEQDAAKVARAAREQRSVTALPEAAGTQPQPITGLEIVYVANQVETESRALHFYVNLPNEIVRDTTTPDGQRFLTWRFKPGQRMRLRIPVETWQQQIVLPIEAVADDGAETYIFVQNGEHFDRQPVHVVYRDHSHAVVANDGSVFPGDIVALNSAHQLQMALKNKAGGGVDPHAGHNH